MKRMQATLAHLRERIKRRAFDTMVILWTRIYGDKLIVGSSIGMGGSDSK